MSVAEQLGLDNEEGELLAGARGLWAGWVREAPGLGVAAGPGELRRWLRTADPATADRVLLELARLGSPTGGDSVPAAGVLAWALLPGASALARRLVSAAPRIDEVVAAQLWIEVRGFPWQRLGKVAANILDNTRVGVLRDCGVSSQLERSDRTWSRTLVADPHSPAWDDLGSRAGRRGGRPSGWWRPEPGDSAAEELVELLDWACAAEVISDRDRALLWSLVVAADGADTRRVGRGHGGLMANDVSAAVATVFGVSPITVRRRARRSLQALTQACTEGRFAA